MNVVGAIGKTAEMQHTSNPSEISQIIHHEGSQIIPCPFQCRVFIKADQTIKNMCVESSAAFYLDLEVFETFYCD